MIPNDRIPRDRGEPTHMGGIEAKGRRAVLRKVAYELMHVKGCEADMFDELAVILAKQYGVKAMTSPSEVLGQPGDNKITNVAFGCWQAGMAQAFDMILSGELDLKMEIVGRDDAPEAN